MSASRRLNGSVLRIPYLDFVLSPLQSFPMLHWLYYLLLLLFLVCGLAINIFTLPGNWLMLLAVAAYAWATEKSHYVGLITLGILLILAIIGEFVETFAAGRGVKKQGGSRWGSVGALVGGILGGILLTGLIPIPVLGTLCGILLGTFLGATLLELVGGKQVGRSALIGVGAAGGRFVGTTLKIAVGCIMLIVSMIVAIPWRG